MRTAIRLIKSTFGLGAVLILLPGPAAAQSPERALVAFSLTVIDGHGEIYVMRSDGSQRRRITGGTVPLTRHAPSSYEPAWSPDGASLVFVRRRDRESGSSIRTLDLATGRARALTGGHLDAGPAWSPDGGRIAFSRSDREGTSILVVPAEGGPVSRLTVASRQRLDVDPAWSPDGSAIAFSRITYHRKAQRIDQDVFVMRADGTGARRVASNASSPAWSPDGTRIAFLSARDGNGSTCFEECTGNNELYLMNADGTGQRRLTRTKGDESAPAWSPDGARIAFDSDRNSPEGSDGGGRELYSVGTDGSCLTWLSNGGADSIDPAWQPGAGRATDPGPGCGAIERAPAHDVDVAPLRAFRRFPLYWLGPEFGNLLLSAISGRAPLYVDCGSYHARACPERIDLQNASICNRHPFSYGAGRGGGETGDFVYNGTLARHRFVFRGAIAAAYPSSGGWDVYTGATTVTVFGVGSAPSDVKRVIRALRPVTGAVARHLPAPAFPRVFWRKLHRFERAYRTLGSVRAVGRELRVTPRAVRDKLSLGRLLRRHGVRRRSPCQPRKR